MKKYLYHILMLLFVCTQTLDAKVVIEEKALEPAIVSVVYERIRVTDTLHAGDDYKRDLLTLKAGKNYSAFYSAAKKTNDSICNRNFDYMMALMNDQQSFRRIASLENEVIFKNYPEGENTVFLRFNLSSWYYQEPVEKPSWQLVSDSSKVICGYECLKAICSYRGRQWTAWYSPEIPVQEEPWKLLGLPGLILEAHDDKRHYLYSAVKIQSENVGDVEYFNYDDRFRTDRTKALVQSRKALGKSIKNAIMSSGAYGIKRQNTKADTGRPPHTNFDFEETDYPHE